MKDIDMEPLIRDIPNDEGGEKREMVDDDASVSLGDILRKHRDGGSTAGSDTTAEKSNNTLSLRKILGGDALTSDLVRGQVWLMLLVTAFIIAYIAQGYSYKKYLLEIDRLQTQLQDAKYRALAVESELTEHTRESRVIDLLEAMGDSTLHASTRPPYIILIGGK